MNRSTVWIIVALLAAATGGYFWMRQGAVELDQVQVPPTDEAESAPVIEHPVTDIELPQAVEEQSPPEPLPALADSDSEVGAAAIDLLGADAVARHLVAEQLVNRLVATIDSLTSSRMAPLMMPWQPLPGAFQVLRADDEVAISPANAGRYDALVGLVAQLDSARLVALYVRYYPLFQESYETLGYPGAYFNDRLVEVIDHLLATPEPAGVIALVPVESVYLHADPELEALSAGQKLLLRAGPAHAGVIKGKLREIRALVAKDRDS